MAVDRGKGVLLLVLFGIAAMSFAGCGGSSPADESTLGAEGGTARKQVYEVSGLHPIYADVDALAAAADLIVVGKPTTSQVIEGENIEDDPDGAPLSGLPVTEYGFLVEQVDKGPTGLVGGSIAVRVIGGETESGSYVVETRKPLTLGDTYLLFLSAGEDGAYYPLAGDGAVAAKTSSGDFVLPPEVVGTEGVTIPAGVVNEADPEPKSQPPAAGPVARAAVSPVRVPSVKGKRVLVRRGVAKISLVCPDSSAPCRGRASVLVGGGKPRLLALARYSIPAGQAKTLGLKLSARGRQMLVDAPPRGMKVRILLDPDGETGSSSRALTLRLP